MTVYKADITAAERLLSKAVSIARCHLTLASTEHDYDRCYENNFYRFCYAIEGAAVLTEDPAAAGTN